MSCPTQCTPACQEVCHEIHKPMAARSHPPSACPGRVVVGPAVAPPPPLPVAVPVSVPVAPARAAVTDGPHDDVAEAAGAGDRHETAGDTPATLSEDAPTNPDTPGVEAGDTLADTPEEPAELDEQAEQEAEQLEQRFGDRSRQTKRPPYDWGAMKRYYVEGYKRPTDGLLEYPTLDATAEKFNASPGYLREVAGREGWRAQRTQWQAQVEQQRRVNRANALSQEAVNLDGKALEAAKSGLQLCIAKLGAIGNSVSHARTQAGAGPAADEATVRSIDAQEQQRLAQAVDLWHKVALRAIGDPETHKVEISGPNGRPIEISAELQRDDVSRISSVLGVLAQAGIGPLFADADDAERTLEAHRREDGSFEALPSGG